MPISNQLYKGNLIAFSSIDHENDPMIEVSWSNNSVFMRSMYIEPMKPRSLFEIKKKYEEIEKQCEEEKNRFHYQVRSTLDNRLLGFCEINSISWTNRSGSITLGIGDPADHRKGIGSEILKMLMDIAFTELNLERLSALIPEYDLGACALFERAGFAFEGRRREAIFRDLRRWDILHYGLIKVAL